MNRLLKYLRRKIKRHHWTKLVNAESESGEWDWFRPIEAKLIVDGEVKFTPIKPRQIKLVRFDENNHHIDEWVMTEAQWKDLVDLVRRIS